MQWNLKEVALKDIKQFSKNPRQIKKEQLQHLTNLIEKFGLIDKPILNADLTCIGGHQRLRILKKKGINKVECWVAENQLDEKEVEQLCIGLNLNQGEFDWDILANEWDAIDLLNWGFTEDQLVGDADELEDGKQKKDKKLKECPNCGHEF